MRLRVDALSGLLARVLPAVYADPNRPRRCRYCGELVTPQERVRGVVAGWFCSTDCASAEWVDSTA